MALTTFSDLVIKARARACLRMRSRRDSKDDGKGIDVGGLGAAAYADAVSTYLGLAVDRLVDRGSAICSWDSGYAKIRNTFARQAIPMTWDFAEGNPFSESTGNFEGAVKWTVETAAASPIGIGGLKCDKWMRLQQVPLGKQAVIATDPPYYDNIGYADLSDFFYVWLRRSLSQILSESVQHSVGP